MTQFKVEVDSDEKILFGSAEKSITPTPCKQLSLSGYGRFKRCKGYHDTIYARVNLFAVEAGKNDIDIKLILVNYDLTGFGYQNTLLLKERLAEKFSIEKSGVYCFSTHSHYSPDTDGLMPAPIFPNIIWKDKDKYLVDFIINQTIKAVELSLKNLTPAKVGFGYTQFRERMVFNRRPPKGYYQILHPKLNIIRIDDYNNSLLGAICVFPSHPVMMDREFNEISGGWPGFFVDALKSRMKDLKKIKKKIIPLILQGPSGDVTFHYRNPEIRDQLVDKTRKERQYFLAYKFGELLAEYVAKKIPKIATKPLKKIFNDGRDIYMPITPIFKGCDQKQLLNILAAAIKRVILIPGLKFFRRRKYVSFVTLERIKVKNRPFKQLHVKTFVGSFALNDIIVTTNPGEPYNITQQEIRDRTSNQNVILAQLCNDCIGYNFTNVNKIYYPATYDIQMTFTQYAGILTRNTSIKEVNSIMKLMKNGKN